MKILITTLGSTGDVLPYMALAQTLGARGHQVVICTHSYFQPRIEQAGIPFAAVNNDLVDLLQSSIGKSSVSGLDRFSGFFKTLWGLRKQIHKLQADALADCWQAASQLKPDLILYNSKTSCAIDFAEYLGCKVMPAFLFPQWEHTRQFPALGLPDAGSAKGWRGNWHALSYRITNTIASRLGRRVIGDWRSQQGLPPADKLSLIRTRDNHLLPELLGYSQYLLTSPKDWPDSISVTGFWRTEVASNSDISAEPSGLSADSPALSKELEAFLSAGDSPVYIGFGSMGSTRSQTLVTMMAAGLKRLGLRAIIAGGWGGLAQLTSDKDLLFIDAAPHQLLFPSIKAVVCHGGAGTVSAALHAAKPVWVCPFFGDQLLWGRQIKRLGLGPEPVLARKLSGDNFSTGIQALVSNSEYQDNATRMARKLNAEQGTVRAAEVIERYMQIKP